MIPYRKTPQKALRGIDTNASPTRQELHPSGVEDNLFAMVERIDTDTFLQSVYEVRNSSTFAWPGDCVGEATLSNLCTFRDGFGGLRLAAAESETSACQEMAA